jgi:hypothetical protein
MGMGMSDRQMLEADHQGERLGAAVSSAASLEQDKTVRRRRSTRKSFPEVIDSTVLLHLKSPTPPPLNPTSVLPTTPRGTSQHQHSVSLLPKDYAYLTRH